MKEYRVAVLRQAFHDLATLQGYIAVRSPINAERFAARMRREIDKLAHSGASHASIPKILDIDYVAKQIVVWPYRIIYRIVGEVVEVMHIRHGAMNALVESDLTI